MTIHSPLPDSASHVTGWSCKKINSCWCVGMAGNLDTTHDAVITINPGPLRDGDAEAERIALWIVEKYNNQLRGR